MHLAVGVAADATDEIQARIETRKGLAHANLKRTHHHRNQTLATESKLG
jgi:hypothetical protein